MLERCDDIEGVIRLLGITRNITSRSVALIFENVGENYQWFSHKGRPVHIESGLEDLSSSLSKEEIKYFMHCLHRRYKRFIDVA